MAYAWNPSNRFNENDPHIAQDVYNYDHVKVCNLFDSSQDSPGQAYDIELLQELGGWKQLTFNMPYVLDAKRNFRWDFIQNEYLLRLTIGEHKDFFIIHAPKKTKSRRELTNQVTCSHISAILKTKNLYLSFDDENGIGTIQYLMEQILKGTGWKLGTCDKMLENDGETERVRSLKSDGKDGAYQLITDVCNLFFAYPVFNGDTRTVDIHAFKDKGALCEIMMGKDIESLSVEYNSEDIITRLYVEGEYGDDGYIGIDDVNPTGLNYLMNFEYYKKVGLFTDEHQKVLDKYYETMKKAIEAIKSVVGDITAKENALNQYWGQGAYVFYVIENQKVARKFIGGDVKSEQLDIKEGDSLVVLQKNRQYRKALAGADGAVSFTADDLYAIKFVTKPSASIGAKEVAIESKEKLIANYQERLKGNLTDQRRADLEGQIAKLRTEIQELYNGNETTTGLYEMMRLAADAAVELNALNQVREKALNDQDEVEVEFAVTMGDMLKDGYWNNDNYVQGQEKFLYADAVDMMNEMAKPAVKYTVSRVSLAGLMGQKGLDLELNAKVRIYDTDLGVNDYAYISKKVSYLDKPENDTVEISNEDITLSGLSLDSILARITKLADLIEQKNALFNRAEAINPDGSIYIERLEGQINVLKNQLMSSVSNWYTDANGNLIFESSTGKSAMMLSGEGFAIANGRTETGEWNWRTFGTGEGFTADCITTGFLSADRIEARSITVDKLESRTGAMLDLSENNSIQMIVEEVKTGGIYKGSTPPDEKQVDSLWLDTTDPEHCVLKKYNGMEWVVVMPSQKDLDALADQVSNIIKKSPTPPEDKTDGTLWLDTSDPEKDVLKRWKADPPPGAWVETTLTQQDIQNIYKSIEDVIQKGPEPPKNPKQNDLWIDTSDDEGTSVLKRWESQPEPGNWVTVNVAPADLDQIYKTLTEYRSEITALSNEINLRVTAETVDEKTGELQRRLESLIKQTEDTIDFQFNAAKQYTVEATGPFRDFIDEVRSYQRFSADGLELGVLNSPFIAKLSNTKLSFIQDGVEIAYISNNKLHITEARVTEKLAIGTEKNGYFDWITLPTGMALKWRNSQI